MCACVFVVCCLATPYISLRTSGLGDCKVARVGRPTTEYKLVVRPWESGNRPCISCLFPTVGQLLYVSMCARVVSKHNCYMYRDKKTVISNLF